MALQFSCIEFAAEPRFRVSGGAGLYPDDLTVRRRNPAQCDVHAGDMAVDNAVPWGGHHRPVPGALPVHHNPDILPFPPGVVFIDMTG